MYFGTFQVNISISLATDFKIIVEPLLHSFVGWIFTHSLFNTLTSADGLEKSPTSRCRWRLTPNSFCHVFLPPFRFVVTLRDPRTLLFTGRFLPVAFLFFCFVLTLLWTRFFNAEPTRFLNLLDCPMVLTFLVLGLTCDPPNWLVGCGALCKDLCIVSSLPVAISWKCLVHKSIISLISTWDVEYRK